MKGGQVTVAPWIVFSKISAAWENVQIWEGGEPSRPSAWGCGKEPGSVLANCLVGTSFKTQ